MKKLFIISNILIIFFISSIYVVKYYIYRANFIYIVDKYTATIDPNLIMAIIKTESNFNSLATSYKGAKGLMQIMENTYYESNNKNNNIYDIQNNLRFGIEYFEKLVKRYKGNYYLAIISYNAGLGNVDKWLKQGLLNYAFNNYKNNNIPFNETKKYLYKIILRYKIYNMFDLPYNL